MTSPFPSDPMQAAAPMRRWLVMHEGARTELPTLLEELAARFNQIGVPVSRVSVSLGDFHPEVIGRSFSWSRLAGAEEVDRRFLPKQSNMYLASPIRVVHDGASAVRRRLDVDEALLDFDVTRELKAQGASDYVGFELPFSDGNRHFISFATDKPGGFETAHLALIDELLPFIGLRIEIEHARRATEQLLANYLGREAARRVIAGSIRRQMGEAITAIVLATDLRGFTALADSLAPDAVIDTLSHYYDSVAEPVRLRGGDIVKMVGDGILAIFPLSGFAPESDQAQSREALSAARDAVAALAALPPSALPDGVEELHAGFALHVGQVMFGNVGSRERLDFTVIGSTVNEAFRLEALTKTIGVPIVTSAGFAALVGGEGLTSAGFHTLRGLREPKEVFALAGAA
ncbi:MAG: hypothetical protein GC199_01715 [Alphaproteobacteria bacterium]|nr:hypothetical protein [Alphaproteobacteria bacterium]